MSIVAAVVPRKANKRCCYQQYGMTPAHSVMHVGLGFKRTWIKSNAARQHHAESIMEVFQEVEMALDSRGVHANIVLGKLHGAHATAMTTFLDSPIMRSLFLDGFLPVFVFTNMVYQTENSAFKSNIQSAPPGTVVTQEEAIADIAESASAHAAGARAAREAASAEIAAALASSQRRLALAATPYSGGGGAAHHNAAAYYGGFSGGSGRGGSGGTAARGGRGERKAALRGRQRSGYLCAGSLARGARARGVGARGLCDVSSCLFLRDHGAGWGAAGGGASGVDGHYGAAAECSGDVIVGPADEALEPDAEYFSATMFVNTKTGRKPFRNRERMAGESRNVVVAAACAVKLNERHVGVHVVDVEAHFQLVENLH
ncbi:hypothetical protein JKP88DRAFT_287844 [Tribonema minus]|uniref:Uncharacterized protein n=1 Tax=Tribonema minus TaxID=303371 RepID=A0A835ZCM3_9STRA|nr:hypothetical protein JKP88DRAFT_287844 [Tribonema minus]